MESANNCAKKCFSLVKICIIENKFVLLHAFFAEAPLTRCHPTPTRGARHKPSCRLFVVGEAEAIVRFMSQRDIRQHDLPNAKVHSSIG